MGKPRDARYENKGKHQIKGAGSSKSIRRNKTEWAEHVDEIGRDIGNLAVSNDTESSNSDCKYKYLLPLLINLLILNFHYSW